MARKPVAEPKAAVPANRKARRNTTSMHLSFGAPLEAKTEAQRQFIEEWYTGTPLLVGSGSAGSGKTYLAVHLALEAVMRGEFEKLIIVRSAVAVRDIGFLPGTEAEKQAVYTLPYAQTVNEIFGCGTAWEQLVKKDMVQFITTSFTRGITFRNAVVIVDEFQNMNDGGELRTILTRADNDTRIVCIGDTRQCDFTTKKEKSGYEWLVRVTQKMSPKYSAFVEFLPQDIVRSAFVKALLIADEEV